MNESFRFIEATKTLEITLKNLEIYDYLYKDNTVTEVDINPEDNAIYTYIQGKGNIHTGKFADPEKVRHLINILASLENLVINSQNPRISTTLPILGARVEGIVEPVVKHPCCFIRKKISKLLSLDDYVKQGTFTYKEKEILENYVKAYKNILIIGGTNTGKTTFANALMKCMDINERLYIIEEVKELQTQNKNVVPVQIFPGIFTAKDALKTALRSAPDRIIYGEVRGAEAFDLINAFTSGHSGGVSTIHADDCYLGLDKLETYIMYQQENPMSKVIARAIDVVVTLKMKNNQRMLHSIAEVKEYRNGKYILDFKFKNNEFEILDENLVSND